MSKNIRKRISKKKTNANVYVKILTHAADGEECRYYITQPGNVYKVIQVERKKGRFFYKGKLIRLDGSYHLTHVDYIVVLAEVPREDKVFFFEKEPVEVVKQAFILKSKFCKKLTIQEIKFYKSHGKI